MPDTLIVQTERISLRKFSDEDAPFIIQLLNSKGWLDFIGNRNVNTTEDALNYLNKSIYSGYNDNGFGLWKVTLNDGGVPIGMCGLLKRADLPASDIGFAFLPEYIGKGFGQEASKAVLQIASEKFKLDEILAITDPANTKSIELLIKSGFGFNKSVPMHEGKETLLLFSNRISHDDEAKINLITSRFYAVFDNRNNKGPHLDLLRELCYEYVSIFKYAFNTTECFSLDSFIPPRKKILTDGTLSDFTEKELTSHLQIENNLAVRTSQYIKSGILNGRNFETKGTKFLNFVRANSQWKLVSILWEDDEQ
ncbi:MAG: GNAT family N-acetyltransferase [Bacteroidia bacterium]|nr:GNAT family N-acetyltransferase [Bacteroidia bacterium]